MRRRRLLTAAAAALTAGLSGCASLGLGGGDGGDGTTPAPTSQGTPTATETRTDSDPGQDTTSTETTTLADAPEEAALLPDASAFGADWTQTGTAARSGGAVGTYTREREESDWEMSLLVRQFDAEESASDNLAEEQDRLSSYAGIEIKDASVGDESFGVNRTIRTATLWFRDATIVSSIEIETDYNFEGGGPEIVVSDLEPLAESAIGAWS